MFRVINYLAYGLILFLIVYLTSGKVKLRVNSMFFTTNAAVYWVSAMNESEALADSLKKYNGQASELQSLVVTYSKLNELFYEGSLQEKLDWSAFFELKPLSRYRWVNNLERIVQFNFLLLENAHRNKDEAEALFYQERLWDSCMLLIKSNDLYSKLVGQSTLSELLKTGLNEVFQLKLTNLDSVRFEGDVMLSESQIAFEMDIDVVVNEVSALFEGVENEDVHLLQQNMYRQANVIEKEFFSLLETYWKTGNKADSSRYNLLKQHLMARAEGKPPIYSHLELLERYEDEFKYFVSKKERRQYSFLAYKIMSDYMRTFLQFDYLTFIDTVKSNQKMILEIKSLQEN